MEAQVKFLRQNDADPAHGQMTARPLIPRPAVEQVLR